MFNSFLYVYQRVAIPNCGTGTTRYNDNSYPLHHGSLNVPIEHRPTIRYMVYNGYYKVMSNIPKMGQLPTPVHWKLYPEKSDKKTYFLKNPMCFFLMFRDDSLLKKKTLWSQRVLPKPGLSASNWQYLMMVWDFHGIVTENHGISMDISKY